MANARSMFKQILGIYYKSFKCKLLSFSSAQLLCIFPSFIERTPKTLLSVVALPRMSIAGNAWLHVIPSSTTHQSPRQALPVDLDCCNYLQYNV